MPDFKSKCAVCGRVSAREHAPKSISECEFDGLPSEEDLRQCNPNVKDLRIRNPGGAVLCTKGGSQRNGFGDRRCYYQVCTHAYDLTLSRCSHAPM